MCESVCGAAYRGTVSTPGRGLLSIFYKLQLYFPGCFTLLTFLPITLLGLNQNRIISRHIVIRVTTVKDRVTCASLDHGHGAHMHISPHLSFLRYVLYFLCWISAWEKPQFPLQLATHSLFSVHMNKACFYVKKK